MASTLIAYYSMSGNTRAIANELRDVIGADADIEEIDEPHRRHGFGGVMRALFDSIARRAPPIVSPAHDPAKYDVVVLGGPVWAGRMASPVRSYARQYGSSAQHVAFFCTEGARGADTAFADLEELCHHSPEATLVIDADHLSGEAHHAELCRFTSRLALSRHDA
jgi:flavodoxin